MTLLTGANGFIGQYLVSWLTDRKWNILPFMRYQNKGVILSDSDSVRKYCSKYQISSIIHLASMVKAIKSYADIEDEVNMAVNLCSALKPGDKFIFFSTADVYAGVDKSLSENSILRPATPYAKAKLQAEKALLKLTEINGVDLVILRPSLVYGPGAPDGMFLGDLLKALHDGEPFSYSSQLIVRDFIHVNDIASAVAEILSQKGHIGGIYNVSTGVGHSLADVVEMVKGILGYEFSLQRDASKGLGVSESIVLNPQKLQMTVNWYPSVSIDTGLKDFFHKMGSIGGY